MAKVSAAAAQLALSSGQAATASAHQSDSASSMAASIEEMTVSINHVSDRSSEAHALSIESGKYAEEGESVIGQTVDDINQIASSVSQASVRIRGLESNSSQISSIVSVVKEVARFGGDVRHMVPAGVAEDLARLFNRTSPTA